MFFSHVNSYYYFFHFKHEMIIFNSLNDSDLWVARRLQNLLPDSYYYRLGNHYRRLGKH